jgi:hypothetical protein
MMISDNSSCLPTKLLTPHTHEVLEVAKIMNIKAALAGYVAKSDRREVVIEPLGVTISDESFVLQRGQLCQLSLDWFLV